MDYKKKRVSPTSLVWREGANNNYNNGRLPEAVQAVEIHQGRRLMLERTVKDTHNFMVWEEEKRILNLNLQQVFICRSQASAEIGNALRTSAKICVELQ